MAVELINVKDYQPKSSDVFFFDNNIWMLLFCPLGNFRQSSQKAYSAFLRSIQTSRSTVFISSLVLSEFANASLKIDFDQWKEGTGNPKINFKLDYVGSERYKETTKAIISSIKNILKIAEKSPDDFNSLNLDNVLDDFELRDFNDNYYLELAISKNWKVVTDDSDFFTYNHHSLKIFTFNDKAFSN
jgi:predicted nucleic acid-binding protein